MRPSRGVTSIYLAAAIVFALVTFSDDWHAIVNDGVAVTALSVASGVLIAALVIGGTRARR
jgi:hypothetical protein